MPGDPLHALIVDAADRRVALLLDCVQEVQPAVLPTPLPGAPEVVEGLVNLRGEVLPAIELRRRLGLPSRAVQLTDCLVVVDAGDVEPQRVVVRVDAADALVQLDPGALVPAASFPGAAYVAGASPEDDGPLVVLDAALFLSGPEKGELRAALTRTSGENGD